MTALVGSEQPRIGPPEPAHHQLAELEATASELGIAFMPWQRVAGRHLTALNEAGGLANREVAAVVGRQNGKTTLVKPVIVRALRKGRRVLHLAQNRELPREMFGLVADHIAEHDEALLPRRRGRIIWPRFGAGQEEIVLTNGGSYRIVAAGRGGARGRSVDIVIYDELREIDSFDVTAAVDPTLTMSDDPQTIYLSNMGDEDAVVLNALRDRALSGLDPRLAYLEWSAAPGLDPGDRAGWVQANPAIGHFPAVLREVESEYAKHLAGGTLGLFEVERLCRAVVSLLPPLVSASAWNACEAGELSTPARAALGVKLDPAGTRAAAVLAWRAPDGVIDMTQLYDVPGHPVDSDRLGRDLRAESRTRAVAYAGYDPQTDQQLARHLPRAVAINGAAFANAASRFAELVESGRLRWHDAAPVGLDLSWTTRKDHADGFIAAPASDAHPVPAAMAAVRAAWLASEPPRDGGARGSVAGF